MTALFGRTQKAANTPFEAGRNPGFGGVASNLTSIETQSAVEEVNYKIQNYVNAWDEQTMIANVTNSSNTTLVNLPELAVLVTAGKRYHFEVTLIYTSAATTNGLACTMGTSTGSAGTISAQINIPVNNDSTSSVYGGHVTSLSDAVVATGTPAANTVFIATIKGIYLPTTSGNLVPQFRSEVSGILITILNGSSIFMREF